MPARLACRCLRSRSSLMTSFLGSNSFMVMLANQPPHLVCIFRMPCGCSRLPFPSPHAQYGKNLTPVPCFQFLVSQSETKNQTLLSTSCCIGSAFSHLFAHTSCVL